MKQYLVSILLLVSGLSACKKTDTFSISTSDTTSTSGDPTTLPFNENIKIKMSETVDSTGRTLFLNCFTEKKFPCLNYALQSTYVLTSDKITINFIKIITPTNICATMPGPAYTVIKIERPTNKVYDVELNVGATTILGQLNVSAGSFNATLPVQTKVQFVNPDLGRVPDNTIFGVVHYHTASTAATVEKFIDSLQFYGAIPTLYPPGDYGHFQIEPSGQIKQVQDGGYYFSRHYIFNYSNSSAPLKSLVRWYGINYRDSLSIELYTAKGEKFYSWIP
jgi:hypothetical protein